MRGKQEERRGTLEKGEENGTRHSAPEVQRSCFVAWKDGDDVRMLTGNPFRDCEIAEDRGISAVEMVMVRVGLPGGG